MAARVGFLAFIAAVLVGLSAIAFPGGSSNGLSSSADPPGFIYVRDQTEIVIVSDASRQEPTIDLLDAFRGDTSRFVESIEPIDSRQAFVGVCCEPADGRQLLLDLDDGTVEFFPFTVRFPSASVDGSRYVGGGSTVTPNNLGAVLAYENGVGVVEPGPDLLVRDDGLPFQPVLLPDERIAVVDVDDSLIVIDSEGATLARSTIGEVEAFDYDSLNDVIVAATQDDVVLLDPDSLSEVAGLTAMLSSESPVIDLDVHDGWILFVHEDGSLRGAPVDAPEFGGQLLEANAETAAWLR